MRLRAFLLLVMVTTHTPLETPVWSAAQQQQVSPVNQRLRSPTSDGSSQAQAVTCGVDSLPLDAQCRISDELAKLAAPDGGAFDYFGYSVAASGDTAEATAF
jgi:hypothetical protein